MTGEIIMAISLIVLLIGMHEYNHRNCCGINKKD